MNWMYVSNFLSETSGQGNENPWNSYWKNCNFSAMQAGYNNHFAPNEPQTQNCSHRDF